MKKSLLALAAFAATVTALPITPALADPPRWADRDRDGRNDRWDRHDNRRDDRRGWRGDNRYDDRGRYRQPHRMTRNDRAWRGNDGRYYCKRDNGTTGLIIGAGVGALAGHQIAGRGDRTLGAILGGVAGGALGREIDKGGLQCR
ncbi:glycine zipper 2TM domain-containing protein [Novosphingobium kaempferiae]|uniref:glycine zipper 2TM domain-containing protein n=1 Tax=Novosphingobium kaempferiae TaxID=2896849 RepID=UPI001E2B08FE|nr:glycine zipper 2TM domain-containing protein [Novosphingobium kaempferiae]